MATLEIMKDLFFIERGYLNANHFVFRSKDPILIDTGYISYFNETERLIAELGVDISETRLIISTHCHCDHIGGNRVIQEKSGCDIALQTIGKYFIDTRNGWSTWWEYYDQEAEFFDCTRALEEGEIVPIGPHRFQVICTPGHSSDGIVLFNKEEGVLISSDTLWETDMAVMTIRVEGSAALFHMLESLEKLESLDVKIVFPGHGKPFSNMKKALLKSKKKIRNYMINNNEIGADLLKKIIVFTLLMKRTVGEEVFFRYLMTTHWFKETIELYFNGEYQSTYDQIMKHFFRRGIVERNNGNLFTTIAP